MRKTTDSSSFAEFMEGTLQDELREESMEVPYDDETAPEEVEEIYEETSVTNIDEAFETLDKEVQEACRRASAYALVLFEKIVALGIYHETSLGSRELVAEHKELAAMAVLWHVLGVEKVETLYLALQKRSTLHRKVLLDGVRDCRERMDGSGPLGKKGNEISYMGRVAALAIELDRQLMVKVSEHPIEDVLADLKAQVPALYDEEFYQALRQLKTRIRKIFLEYEEKARSVPATVPLVKHRTNRPMYLTYRQIEEQDAYHAIMCFMDGKEKTLPYEEVKQVIVKTGIGQELCTYYIYEACDTIRRFDNCGIPCRYIEVDVLPVYVNQRGLCRQLREIIGRENIEPGRIRLSVPAEAMKRPTKALADNMRQCREFGIEFVLNGTPPEFHTEDGGLPKQYPFVAIREQRAAAELYENEDQIVSRELTRRAKE